MIERCILLLLFICVRAFFQRVSLLPKMVPFDRDGRFICSYKNPGYDENRITFNNAFR
jgi:hypothetical protein